MKLFILALITLGLAFTANAQVAPEVILTWKAGAYAPASYSGKILPSHNSNIEVGLELLESGKFANLSSIRIRWDINNELFQSGVGLKTISFTANQAKGDPIVLASFAYKGRAYDKQISIPIAKPEVAVVGGPDVFRALPYFFNIASPIQAKFSWTANGISAEGAGQNPDILNLDTNAASGTEFNISVRVQSLIRELELASQSISYIK